MRTVVCRRPLEPWARLRHFPSVEPVPTPCPSEQSLDGYVRGTASGLERDEVETHLASCAPCRAVVAAVANVATAEPSTGGELDLPAASDRYEWAEPVGEGAMGVVYAAYDRFLDRKVAIKVIRGDAAPREAARRRRLLAESRALARVTHPNVVTVHDVGIYDDELFIAMEFVDGASLRQWLAARQRSWTEILDVFDAALAGLAAVHDAGLVHRDFKPDNVLVGDDGDVKVTDFGLVRGSVGPGSTATLSVHSGSQSLTADGELVGTPAYLAPELFDGGAATEKSDQFAACVALYEALYDRRPFNAPTIEALAQRVGAGDIDEPPAAKVPRRVARVLRRGLAVDPGGRYASIATLAQTLRDARRTRRPRRNLVLGAGLVVVLGASATWVQANQPDPCPPHAGALQSHHRAKVEQAMTAAGPIGRDASTVLLAEIDEWSRRWAAAGDEACAAVHVERRHDDAWLTRAEACLETQRVELAALVTAADRVDARRAWRTVDLARRLPSPEICNQADLAPARAQSDAALDELRATVRAAVYTGDLETARGKIDPLAAMAEDAVDPKLRARALAGAGAAAMEAGRPDDAAMLLGRATEAAIAADAPATTARALLHRVQLEGVWRGHAQQARAFAELARAHVAVLDDPRLEAQLEFTLGNIARSRDDYPLAKEHCDRAVALLDPGTTPLRTFAAAKMCVADMEVQLGDLDRAHGIYEGLVHRVEEHFGDKHPLLGGLYNGLGAVALERDDPAAAERAWRQALRVTEATRGDRDVRTIGLRANLSTALYRQGREDEGRQLLMDAIDVARGTLGPLHPTLAGLLSNLAAEYLEAGDHAAARPWLEQAAAALPQDEQYRLSRADISGNLGLSYLPDDPGAARPHLRRAVDLTVEAVGEKDERVAFQLIALAECELIDEQPKEALTLLRRAEVIYATSERTPAARHARLQFRLSQAVFFAKEGAKPRAEATALALRATELNAESGFVVPRPELEAWVEFLRG